MNEYEKQAEDFLKKTNTKLNIVFDGYKSHFTGETQKRNVYKVTLSNNNGEYTFKFGDSINNFEKRLKPTKYDILACLNINYSKDLEDFCNNYGYSIEDENTEIIFNNVIDESMSLKELFTSAELYLLMEIA